MTPVEPGSPASLVYEGGSPAGSLVMKFHFSKPIQGFRLSCGSAESSLAGAVAGWEYSVDGKGWKPFYETSECGQIPKWVDPKGPKAAGLNTQDLYLRAYVRGKNGSVPNGTRFQARMSGDVMWGDASTTFANAQWRLLVTPK